MMLWTLVLAALSGFASATPVPRSFLGTAFRAARLHHVDAGGAPAPAFAFAPAPAPAPPPPPPPKPDPPKFPVIGQDECELMQEGFLVSPPAVCTHVVFAKNVDGCSCTMVLPANINPQPANFYNPWLIDIAPDPNVPVPRSMPTVPPPSNPLQPFIPPMMPVVCPFSAACADPNAFECVGHNSWGFSSAHVADYSPAAAALNTASCTYMMKPYDRFKVPEKVISLWHLNAKLVKVFDSMSDPFTMFCSGENVTAPSLQFFCKDQLKRLGLPCDMPWNEVTKKHQAQKCAHAPAPDGFEIDSTLADLCPLECGWKKGVYKWPPFPTAAERAVAAAAKKEEDAKAKKEANDRAGLDTEE